MSPLLLLLAALSASAAPTISADQIEISAGVVVGDGGVTAESGNLSMTGERFELVEGKSLIVEQGSLTSPTLGVVTFERAELDLVSEELVIVHGALSGREDHLQLSGDELVISRDGRLTATKISVTACECEGTAPWRVTARKATVDDGSVKFKGGVLRVLEIPVLATPFGSLPTKRQSGLMAPTLMTNDDGVVTALPLYLTLGRQADITLTPEYRTERGGRGLFEGRYATRSGSGQANLGVGHDTLEEVHRGGTRWTHRGQVGEVLMASDGQLTSDVTYLSDYGDSYLARGAPWTLTKTLIGFGHTELSSELTQQATLVDQRVASLGYNRPMVDLGFGVYASTDLGVDLMAVGLDPWSLQEPELAATGGFVVERPATRVGPVRLTPAVEVRGLAVDFARDVQRGYAHTSSLEVMTPLYKLGDGSLSTVEPLVSVGFSGVDAEEVLVGSQTQGAFVAPGVRWRRVSSTAQVDASSSVRLIDDGAVGSGSLRGQISEFSLWGQIEGDTGSQNPDLMFTGIGWGRSQVALLELSYLMADEGYLYQPDPENPMSLEQYRLKGGTALPGTRSALWLKAGLTYDLIGSSPIKQEVGALYRHPSGCLDFGFGLKFEEDRDLPEFGLIFELRPSASG